MTRKELINSPGYVIDQTVKIAGTNYDRRRKVTKSMRRRMIQMYESGKSMNSIANYFNVSFDAVKRAVVPMYDETEKARKKEWRKANNYVPEYDPNRLVERAEYKRNLLIEHKNLAIS